MNSSDYLLRVRELSVTYTSRLGVEVSAVQGVSLDVESGSIHGVVGESGSGKSTVAKAILQIGDHSMNIERGQIEFADRGDLLEYSRAEFRRIRGVEIGYIGQEPFGSLHPILPIWLQFRQLFKAHGRRMSGETSFRRAAEALDAVGITNPAVVLNSRAHQLSGGMAQRVVIALASILKPRLIVADEPTTALDLTTQRRILDLIRERVDDLGASMVLITHDLGVVAQYCHTVTVLLNGRVVEHGPVSNVLTQPTHEYTRSLISSSGGSIK